MPTKSPLLLLGALLTISFSACSSPVAGTSPSEEESTSTSTSSTSSSPSESSSSSVAQSTTQEPTSETPTEPETQVATEESGAQPQAAATEPELLYCEIGLGAFGRFSDGSSHQTELCNTPALQRSVRAEGVCGGLNGHLLYPDEWPELCNGGAPYSGPPQGGASPEFYDEGSLAGTPLETQGEGL